MNNFNNQTSNSPPYNLAGVMTRNSPSPSPLQQQNKESDLGRRRNRDGDICFDCKEQGHWSADCPNKTPEKFRTPYSSPVPPFNRDGDICFNCKEQGHWSADCPNKTPEKFRTPSSPVPPFNRDGDICFNCKEQGHWSADCPNKTPEKFRTPSSSPVPPFNRDGDICFNCKEQGHWSADCPNKIPEKFRTPSSSPVPLFMGRDGLEYSPPSFLCPRCGICCPLKTSQTSKNPDRKFYTCPNGCTNVFKWEDQMGKEELVNVPKCGCGAGFCRQYIETSGTNAGRKYFVCPIKKGQGACTFFKLIDDELLTRNDHEDERIISPQSTMMDHGDANPAKSVRDGNFSHKGVEIESNTVDSAQYSQNQGALSGRLKRTQLMEMELEGEKDTSNEPLRKRNKGLPHGNPQYDGSSLNSVIECIDKPCTDSIRLRQVKFLGQISIEGIALAVSSNSSDSFFYPSNLLQLREDWMVTAATNLNIGLFEGWWGRLAYRPSRCLIFPAPKPFFCCVFPSYDPILVPQSEDRFDFQSSSLRSLPGTQKVSVFPSYDPILVPQSEDKFDFHPSSLRSLPGTQKVSVMKGAISEGFATLARELQNQLLSLLESTDCHKHHSIDREARNTFAALDQLQIGCQPFRERVEEFIKCASTLAEIEGSIRNDQTSHELQEHYNFKKMHFDDISNDYHEAKADLETSRERLQSLHEEASHVKDMLFQVEAELSYQVDENQYHESRFVQISKELKESEQAYQVAFEAAEEALKLFQQRKEARNAAESAYKKARVRLRLINENVTSMFLYNR